MLRTPTHPSIMLTNEHLEALRAGIKTYPLLGKSYAKVQRDADKAMKAGIAVPLPKDNGGGKTHEIHKCNYQALVACATVYQITQDEKYANYVQILLQAYAKEYKTWPIHPKIKAGHPVGKMFWQNLNECVWLVYAIQAYDLVYHFIAPEIRADIEENLFKPMVELITVTEARTFNRVHNHGTWACAAVGMTGYVLDNSNWVNMALYGSANNSQGGFLKQLDELFSPDGYYSEGPYYQRYALLPFVIFAKAIQQYEPDFGIYHYKDGVLKKAVQTVLQLTDENGAFLPLNDTDKNKTHASEEIVYAVDLLYAYDNSAHDLLAIANTQDRVIVSDAGLQVAAAIAAKSTMPFKYKNMWIADGADGKEGGIGILRDKSKKYSQTVVVKATSQGGDHGHYDRLGLLYYFGKHEIFCNYGSVRFLNINNKGGGGYLPENTSFARQSVTHNVMVVDETSHYQGKLKEASQHHPQLLYFNIQQDYRVVIAKEDYAYPNVTLIRATALIIVEGIETPLLVDVMKATSTTPHQYDLPFWYQGHPIRYPAEVTFNTTELKPVGSSNGYQYCWLNGIGKFVANGSTYLTLLNNSRFFTTLFTTDPNTTIKFITTGANDPNHNLRKEQAFMLSHHSTPNHTFVTITESHGKNDPIAETTTNEAPKISALSIVADDDSQTELKFTAGKNECRVKLNYREGQFFTLFSTDNKQPEPAVATARCR